MWYRLGSQIIQYPVIDVLIYNFLSKHLKVHFSRNDDHKTFKFHTGTLKLSNQYIVYIDLKIKPTP
jgi:hypothetical protein